ncbi:MAG TPA: GDP-mannose 4,6-dehydratase [Solirubrobacteraceae bacterium]
MPAPRVLITGITGQDGHYLARLLTGEGCEVVGLARPGSDGVGASALVAADLEDPASLRAAVAEVAPDELYHLAAPTFVPASWDDPVATVDAIAVGTAALLAAAREHVPACRVVVATSSEIFGDAGESPMHERTPMRPASPYGVAKLCAHGLVGAMRTRGLHASSAITFNHESPRRPEHFLPRKVTRGAAAIALGLQETLELGHLRAVRDWSDARDTVRGYVLMARAEEPGDYVLASGVGRTVQDLVDAAFGHAGVDTAAVRVDPGLVRAPEPWPLVGDPSRAAQHLGWRCEIPFEQTIGEMVDADLAELRASAAPDPRASSAG